jgi:hypothetical protein
MQRVRGERTALGLGIKGLGNARVGKSGLGIRNAGGEVIGLRCGIWD